MSRLDAWLAAQHPEQSRSRWQQLIREGQVRVNGEPRKPNYVVRPADEVTFTLPEARPTTLTPEDIPLAVIFEDGDLIALNKPPGLVVHPAPGHDTGTLVHALLHHCPDLPGIGGEQRPGIVHRLDRDTSGVLVVAKTDAALNHLSAQFKQRETRKEYLALGWGRPAAQAGTIRTLIGRSERDRKKMSVQARHGRTAVTHYEVIEQFADCALLRLRIETGRTHQIRVHLAHLGHPVVGDELYGRAHGRRLPVPAARQLLHAARLELRHPRTGQPLVFAAPLPEDFESVLRALRALRA
jgi:23S rRNA pseudouridine1911/1915/1917 synthase